MNIPARIPPWRTCRQNNVGTVYLTVFYVISYICITTVFGQTHLELGDFYQRQSEEFYQEAIREYKLAKSADEAKGKELAIRLAEMYAVRKQYDKILDELLPYYVRLKHNLDIARLVALAYFHLGNFKEAYTVCETVGLATGSFKDVPVRKVVEFLYYYGQTCENLNLYPQAVELYQQLVNQFSTRDKTNQYLTFARERIVQLTNELKGTSIAGLPLRTRQLIAKLPSANEYPGVSAVILYAEDNWEINPDLEITYTQYRLIKIFNEHGVKYGNLEFTYNPANEKIGLDFARTIKSEGVVLSVSDRQIRDEVPTPSLTFFTGTRKKTVTLPEVTEDVILEYQVKKTGSTLIVNKQFYLTQYLNYEIPCLQARYVVKVPNNYELKHKSINPGYFPFTGQLTPRKEATRTATFYTWDLVKIPSLLPERYSPDVYTLVPGFTVSSYKDWRQIHAWGWRTFGYTVGTYPELTAQVNRLLRGKTKEEEKVKLIYNWVTSKIQIIASSTDLITTVNLKDVIQKRYATVIDKTMLFIAMCKEAGLTVYPVLIRPGTDLDETFPGREFTRVLAYLRLRADVSTDTVNKKSNVVYTELFCDPTEETNPYTTLPLPLQGRKGLLLTEKNFEFIYTPLLTDESTRRKVKLEIKFKPDESIEGVYTFSPGGIEEQEYRRKLKFYPPEMVKDELRKLLANYFESSLITNYEIVNLDDLTVPLKLKLDFTSPNFFGAAGNIRLMPRLGSFGIDWIKDSVRKFPIEFPAPIQQVTTVTIQLTPALQIKYLPEPVKVSTPWFDYIHQYIQFPNNIVLFEESVSFNRRTVTVKEYPEFQPVCETIYRNLSKQVVLEYITVK